LSQTKQADRPLTGSVVVAREIADARTFDLDDARAEIGAKTPKLDEKNLFLIELNKFTFLHLF